MGKFGDEIPTVSNEFRSGVFDGDGSIGFYGGNYGLSVAQKDKYLLRIMQKHFPCGQIIDNFVINYNSHIKEIDDFYRIRPFTRTDLAFKHNLLVWGGLDNETRLFTRKLPEYFPAGAVQLYAMLRRGQTLPDALLDVLHTYYPQSLLTYYKDLYRDIYYEKNIDWKHLPFTDSLISSIFPIAFK